MARLELKQSGVLFNEELHTYHLDGKELSGITGMLHRQLFPNEFDGISEEVLNAAAAYGTAVHKSIELFDRDWFNDGTVEVKDYIEICKDNGFVHEYSEYTITDGKNWASNIDKVFRTGDSNFAIIDCKTYGAMTPDKLEKARWQLSIYRYLFLLQNPKATIDRLAIIHLRNKTKRDMTVDHIAEIIEVKPIPSEICKDLLDTDLRGEKFQNPYGIPKQYAVMEDHIRDLITKKNEIEAELSMIKATILAAMEAEDARSWATDSMKLTRKLPTPRTSFNLALLKEHHPEIDYSQYDKVSKVASSLTISI